MSGENGTFESERFSGIESPILTSNYTKKPKSKFRLKGKVKRLQPPGVFSPNSSAERVSCSSPTLFIQANHNILLYVLYTKTEPSLTKYR